MTALRRRLAAESVGTFVLVFAGTGAIITNDLTGAVTHPGIALTFGLVVLALIYALGDVSGAHLNPAVTIGFVAAGRFPAREALPYTAAQCGGAVAASLLLRALFPNSVALGETVPRGSAGQSFVLEVVLTWFLMLVVLCVSTGAREKGITAGVAVGAVIALEAMFAGPICGASMNPARSLAPAVASARLDHLWMYLTAPVLGAVLAVPTFAVIRPTDCPDPLVEEEE